MQKRCPNCGTIVGVSVQRCVCGHQFTTQFQQPASRTILVSDPYARPFRDSKLYRGFKAWWPYVACLVLAIWGVVKWNSYKQEQEMLNWEEQFAKRIYDERPRMSDFDSFQHGLVSRLKERFGEPDGYTAETHYNVKEEYLTYQCKDGVVVIRTKYNVIQGQYQESR